ncbi:MAG TPA: hypothetical protein VK464_08100 [Symbiobacteriaceae bacterium]|jgi:hypothetical protein|nr:hypothetical protein [Symbiobacteriaceae bacterium]
MTMDGIGPYLAPSAIIGIGAWGSAVARGVEDALRDRSPTIAGACPVLAVSDLQPDLIRAHIRAARLAEMIKALEREGLLKQDPQVAPVTPVYLVASLADDPELKLLAQVADVVEQSAAELKARVARAALVDLGVGRPLPGALPACPLYVIEAVTAKGLVLDAAEYQAAAVEALVAAVQPGAGSMLVGPGVKGVGTLGVAWLAWSPAALRASAARRLAHTALLRAAEATTANPGHARQSEVWAAQAPDQRGAVLLAGLPFRAGLHSQVEPHDDLCGPAAIATAAAEGRRLRRCAAVADRRLHRWEQRLEENAWRRAGQEGEVLECSVQVALAAGPDGVARVRTLAAELMKACARRQASPGDAWPAPRIAPFMDDLSKAESLPDAGAVATGLGLCWLLFSLVWWLARGTWPFWLCVGAALAAGGAGYGLWWRPRRIRQAQQLLRGALNRRAAALMQQAYAQALERLDQALEERCDAVLRDLERMVAHLRSQAREEAGAGAGGGALSFPLVGEANGESIARDWLPQAADVAAHLAREGCFRHWRHPVMLLQHATTLTERFLAGRVTLDPAGLAARAYGDRLGERLQEGVQGLFDWAQPLLARPIALPEGRRWLLWPEGLPCPLVDSDVAVVPFARSCAAVVTVIQGIPEGVQARAVRTTG